MNDYKDTPEGREALRLYGDIINRQRPVSARLKMDLIHRAKIFSPYDALRGFDEEIGKARARTRRVPKIALCEEQKKQLSDVLSLLTKGMAVTITTFSGDEPPLGNYVTLEGFIRKIDPVNQYLEIRDAAGQTGADRTGRMEKPLTFSIPFEDILSIEPEPADRLTRL